MIRFAKISALTMVCCAVLASDRWSDPIIPHDFFWWSQFTYSNLLNHVTLPIKSEAVSFLIINGHTDMTPLNPWIVRRMNAPPYRLAPLQGSDGPGCEIRLQSDTAVDFLCKAPALTFKEVEAVWHQPAWFLAFCQSSNTVVGFKAISNETFVKMPDVQKALDNNGELLIESRTGFAERLKSKGTANHTSDGIRQPADGSPRPSM